MMTTTNERNVTAQFGDVVSRLPLQPPERLTGKISEFFAAGRAAAQGTETGVVPSMPSNPFDASDEVQREQAKVRKRALDKLITSNRAACAVGLSCLDDDQYPMELQAWLDDPKARTLILAGGTGSGKTQAAYATAAHSARYGAMMFNQRKGCYERRPLIVRGGLVEEYLMQLRPDGSPDPVWKIRDEAVTAELWIGDDLGAEMDDVATEFARVQIATLQTLRMERSLRQIYTTNLSSEALARAVGNRMWSRVQQDMTLLVFNGLDRRAMSQAVW